jgi:hypothetical protein
MGLLGLWREALQAQRILKGGPPYAVPYGNHPQLERFKSHSKPVDAIKVYLQEIWDEGHRRGYNFDKELADLNTDTWSYAQPIKVSRGQVNYEISLLMNKLEERDPKHKQWLEGYLVGLITRGEETPLDIYPSYSRYNETHPLFTVDNRDKGTAPWERVKETTT